MSKKQISVYKFLRVARNKKSVKVRGLHSSASFSLPKNYEQSLEAYVLDGFIYMWLKRNKQEGNRIKTYFVRYELGSNKAIQDFVTIGGRV